MNQDSGTAGLPRDRGSDDTSKIGYPIWLPAGWIVLAAVAFGFGNSIVAWIGRAMLVLAAILLVDHYRARKVGARVAELPWIGSNVLASAVLLMSPETGLETAAVVASWATTGFMWANTVKRDRS